MKTFKPHIKVNTYTILFVLLAWMQNVTSTTSLIDEKARYTISSPSNGLCGTHTIIYDIKLDLYMITCAWGSLDQLRILLFSIPDWQTTPQLKGEYLTRDKDPY